MPTGGKQSTVCRVQINLTSLCHRGIGRSIGDCCSGAWGCKIISDGSSTAFIRRGRRWSANRRHCSTFLLKRFPPDLNRRDSQRVKDERIFVH